MCPPKKEDIKKPDQQNVNLWRDVIIPVSIFELLPEEMRLPPREIGHLGTIFGWIDTSISCVKSLFRQYRSEEITFSNMLEFFKNSSIDDYIAMYELLSHYVEFKQSKAGPQLHSLSVTDDELEAQALFEKKVLTEEEKQHYLEILQRLELKLDNQERIIGEQTQALLEIESWQVYDESQLREEATKQYCQLHNTNALELDLNARIIIDIAVSRVLVQRVSNIKPGITIDVLVPIASEQNRLQKRSQVFSGEDALRKKIRQLEFLLAGTNLEWRLVIVDDEAPHDKERSVDLMRAMLSTDELLPYSQNVVIPTESDLKNGIEAYDDTKLAGLSVADFQKISYKGGAVHLGLRYICSTRRENQNAIVVLTDFDTSTDLRQVGSLVYQISQGHDVAIGSRRISGAHVLGKSQERHLQSYLFNLIVRTLLNLQLTDTQVGAQVFLVSKINEVSSKFHELGMAYSVELLRLLSGANAKIIEKPIIWIDSVYESKSVDQSLRMLLGLLRITSDFYPDLSLQSPKQQITELAEQLAGEKNYLDLIELASNRKLHIIIDNFINMYDLLAPDTWRQFMREIRTFIIDLSNGEFKQQSLHQLIQSGQALISNMVFGKYIGFILQEFPQLYSAIDLLHRNPSYARIIMPMLFGDNIITRLFTDEPRISYFGAMQKKIIGQHDGIVAWVQSDPGIERKKHTRLPLKINHERIDDGFNQLRDIHSKISGIIKIGIVVQFNVDQTSKEYVDKNLIGKMQDLANLTGTSFEKISWHFIIVDAREKRQSSIAEYIQHQLEPWQSNITGELIVQENPQGKAAAIRLGMTYAVDIGCNYAGYIDFSDKIPIGEIGNLLAQLLYETTSYQIAIGSRRMDESAVINKPLTFILRSTFFNLLVRMLFPSLYDINDSQTGFKFFSARAWNEITALGLTAKGLAFDVEILAQARRIGLNIAELPVDFYDNMQDHGDSVGEDLIGSLFTDLLQVRSIVPYSAVGQKDGDAILWAGGAESLVYKLPNNTLLKIPHAVASPEFFGVLVHLFFKKRQKMSIDQQERRLLNSRFFQAFLSSRRGKALVSVLRECRDINVFVMRLISAFENKDYKSQGYYTAYLYGRDLIVPFRFITKPIEVTLEGVKRSFKKEDKVKQSVFAITFKERLLEIVRYKINDDFENRLDKLFANVLELFRNLWLRGLFDLDSNVLCDMGFYTNSLGQEVLMVLDPGEMVASLEGYTINDVQKPLLNIQQRSDYIELAGLLAQPSIKLPDATKKQILQRLIQQLEDVRTFVTTNFQSFAYERESANDFTITFPREFALVETDVEDAPSRQLEALSLSAAEYQRSYNVKQRMPILPAPSTVAAANPIYRLVPYTSKDKNEIRVRTGSIKPVLEVCRDLGLYHDHPTVVLQLDAGSASRLLLLKYVEESRTKGAIKLGSEPLSQHAFRSIAPVLQVLPKGYIVIISSDDLLEIDDEFTTSLDNYFKWVDGRQVGMYWCDLPNGGSEYLPMTVRQMHQFLFEHADLLTSMEQFLRQIPFARSLVEAGGIANLFYALKTVSSSILSSDEETDRTKIERKLAHTNLPGLSIINDFIKQLIQYNALMKLGGMKKPFFYIFTQAFMHDLINGLLPLIPDYIIEDITWESLLIYGIKCDLPFWKSNKPAKIRSDQWVEIWDVIKAMKERHHINTEDETQNRLRVFSGAWHNFDDPLSLCDYLCDCSMTAHVNRNKITVRKSSGELLDVETVYAQSQIDGEVIIIANGDKSRCLFYQVQLSREDSLQIPAGHLVVMIDQTIYSIDMSIASKKELKNKMVYRYENGTGNPYKKLDKFRYEMDVPPGGKLLQSSSVFFSANSIIGDGTEIKQTASAVNQLCQG